MNILKKTNMATIYQSYRCHTFFSYSSFLIKIIENHHALYAKAQLLNTFVDSDDTTQKTFFEFLAENYTYVQIANTVFFYDTLQIYQMRHELFCSSCLMFCYEHILENLHKQILKQARIMIFS